MNITTKQKSDKPEMTRQEKAEACLLAIAELCEKAANGEPALVFETDWNDFGAATLVMNGGHTHIGGSGVEADKEIAFTSFVDGLYGQLVLGRGLSWVKEQE